MLKNDDTLLNELLSDENLKIAKQRVKKNKGASGIDGMEVKELDEYLSKHLDEIKEQIRNKKYSPKPVKRVEIPKPDDEREEQQADEALQQHKPALRRLIAFGFKLYCFHWGPPTGAPSCCIAKQTASAALGECFRRAAASCREE